MKPDSFGELIGYSLVSIVVITILAWITIGVVHDAIQPPAPKLSAQEQSVKEFTDSCKYRDGVPNTNVNPWTCERIEK